MASFTLSLIYKGDLRKSRDISARESTNFIPRSMRENENFFELKNIRDSRQLK